MGSQRGTWLAAALGAGIVALGAALWLVIASGDGSEKTPALPVSDALERPETPIEQVAPAQEAPPASPAAPEPVEPAIFEASEIEADAREFRGIIRLSDSLSGMDDARRTSLIESAKRSIGKRLAMAPLGIDEAVIHPREVEGEVAVGAAGEPALRDAVRQQLTVYEVMLHSAADAPLGQSDAWRAVWLVEHPDRRGEWLEVKPLDGLAGRPEQP